MVINPIVVVFIPIIRIPITGGMTIPNIATFDHGTHHLPVERSSEFQSFGICFLCVYSFFFKRSGTKHIQQHISFGQMIATNQWLRIPPNGGDLVRESLPICPFIQV